MYRELLAIFRKNILLDKAYKRSYEMLEITCLMFKEIKQRLREDEKHQFSFDIMDQDIAVNKYEREVRRHVFNHLCVSGMEDLNSGLVLTSIIIDIERIGDYTKNMVELAMAQSTALKNSKFEKDIKKIESAIENSFVRVRNIFEKGTIDEAKSLLQDYQWINKSCDDHINYFLTKDEKLFSSGEAVAYTLYFRYLKRINSHLRNIATSVVNPFHRIGFELSKTKK